MNAQVRGSVTLYAQITRADGKVERRRLIGYYHPNPFRQFAVRLLMRLGVV